MHSGREGREHIAGPDDGGRRLDRILRVLLRDRSLSEIYAALRKGKILVNDRKAEPAHKIASGDRIFLDASLEPSGERGSDSDSVDGTLEELGDLVLAVTRDLIFINKPRGLLSQGPEGVEARVRSALARRSALSLSFVPGPLHRLDRNTSGILTFPATSSGARAFTELVRERRIVKRYVALVDGEASEAAEWRDRIERVGRTRTSAVSEAGPEARSSMRPLLAYGGRSLILVEIQTGLTHQIRVQASSRGLPLSGDLKYGGEAFEGGYILHALALEFPQPPFEDLPGLVVAPLPREAQSRLSRLFGAEAVAKALTLAAAGGTPR